MKIKEQLILRKLGTKSFITDRDIKDTKLTNVYEFNETASWLWEQLKGQDFEARHMAKLLTKRYEVDYMTALHDSYELINSWKENGFITD